MLTIDVDVGEMLKASILAYVVILPERSESCYRWKAGPSEASLLLTETLANYLRWKAYSLRSCL